MFARPTFAATLCVLMFQGCAAGTDESAGASREQVFLSISVVHMTDGLPVLNKSEAERIAKLVAIKALGKIDQYNVTKVSVEKYANLSDDFWGVMFSSSPAAPGGFFVVMINRRNGESRILPGA